MPFDDNQILQDYIAHLLTIQDQRGDWLDEKDLQQAARDLGLSDAELAQVEASVEAHRQRAAHYLEHACWDEAIDEFRQAMALRPLDATLAHDLTLAYYQRWEISGQPDDRDAAMRYAQRTVQLDPQHTASYALIRTLKNPPARVTEAALARTPLSPRKMFLGLALVLLVAVGISFLMNRSTTAEPDPVALPPAEAPAAPATGRFERDLPAQLVADEHAAGLQFDARRSRLTSYGDSYSYRLYASIHNASDELHRLRLRMDLLDASGAVVRTKAVDALSEHMPPLRPGDALPVSELIHESTAPPEIHSVRLAVEIVDREPAAADYGTAEPLPLGWETPQPAGLAIALTERENRLTNLFNERAHFLSLALQNTGERSVEQLRIRVTWYDAQGQPATSTEKIAVPSTGPALRAGEIRVFRVIGKFPPGDAPPFARYEVTVLEAS